MMDSAVEDFMRGNLLPFIQSDRFDLSAVVANWQEVFLDIVEKDRAQLVWDTTSVMWSGGYRS